MKRAPYAGRWAASGGAGFPMVITGPAAWRFGKPENREPAAPPLAVVDRYQRFRWEDWAGEHVLVFDTGMDARELRQLAVDMLLDRCERVVVCDRDPVRVRQVYSALKREPECQR